MLRQTLCLALPLFLVITGICVADKPDTCDGLPLVFADDFEKGTDRWETTDDKAWELHDHDGGKAFGLNRR